ncbi:MAG: acyltransferase, partial [Myxococcota bacterium]
MSAIPVSERSGSTSRSIPVRRFHAPPLDGLRALAFLLVFLSHVPGLWFFPGGFGVTVFFFLSGYLITTLLRIEHEQTGGIDIARFFGRRFLRILPPYFLTLAVVWGAAALGAFPRSDWQLEPLWWQALFATNYRLVAVGADGMVPGTEVYWSLAVEEHFYLLFPWVAVGLFAIRSGPVRGWTLLAGCAAVLAWRIALFTVLDPGDADRLTYATDTRIDSILFGCALALGRNPVLDPPIGWATRRPAWVLAAFGAAIVATLVPRDPLFRETIRYSLQGLLLIPV